MAFTSTREFAAIILYNDAGEMLLQHRSEDAPVAAGYWGVFGGGVENDESPQQAVSRECEEELGYELAAPRLIVAHRSIYEGRESTIFVFTEKYSGRALVLGEGQDWGWFSVETTENLQMEHFMRTIIQQAADAIARERS